MNPIESAYWFRSKSQHNNAGDEVTPYLYEKITGKKLTRIDRNRNRNRNNDYHVIGCGSILTSASSKSIVWGTGAMFPDPFTKRVHQIRAVRGPLTRNVILKGRKNDCPEIYGDPGLLLPLFFSPIVAIKYRVGIIPHYIDYEIVKKMVPSDVVCINIKAPLEQVITQILECENLMSSSLHGIIFSHAYSRPCAWLDQTYLSGGKIGGGKFKYHDYYASRKITPYPSPISPNLLTKSSAEDLANIIKEYPQPSEPYDTNILMDLCPFQPTKS